MEVELLEIQHFLSQYPPFNLLPEEAIKEAAQSVEISYYRAESMVIGFGDEIKDLYMVRSGIIEVYRRNGDSRYSILGIVLDTITVKISSFKSTRTHI